jgi:hypothetical protein
MEKVKNKLQVRHYAQVPCKPFCVDVDDEIEAKKVMDILTYQHLFLFHNKIIPDYANMITVVMWDEDSDGEGTPGWGNYHNEDEGMEWDEFEETYLKQYEKQWDVQS